MERVELQTVHWIIFSQTDWEMMQSEEVFFLLYFLFKSVFLLLYYVFK